MAEGPDWDELLRKIKEEVPPPDPSLVPLWEGARNMAAALAYFYHCLAAANLPEDFVQEVVLSYMVTTIQNTR